MDEQEKKIREMVRSLQSAYESTGLFITVDNPYSICIETDDTSDALIEFDREMKKYRYWYKSFKIEDGKYL